jgi:hypothetical protein
MENEQSTAPTTVQEQASVIPTIETPPAKSFSEDDINRIVRERLDRERKKYSDYDDLKAAKSRLDEIELANKTNEEKALIRLKELEDKLAAKEQAIKQADLREKKRTAIECAGLGLPKDVSVSDLMDMIPGESDEAIEAAIGKFKKLFPINKAQGMGTQVIETPNVGKKTIDMRLAELQFQLKDRSLDNRSREDLAREMLSLNNKKMREMVSQQNNM